MLQVNWCDIEPSVQCHINWLVALNRCWTMLQVNWYWTGSMSHQLTCRHCSTSQLMWHWTGSMSHQLMWHWTDIGQCLQVNWCDIVQYRFNVTSIDVTLNRYWTMLQVNWCDIVQYRFNVTSIDVTLNRCWTMLQVNWCDIEPMLDNTTSQLMWHWTDVGQCYKSIDVTLSNIGSMSHQLMWHWTDIGQYYKSIEHCPISVQCHINWHL